MKNFASRMICGCALFVVSACAQQPVNVVDKGSQFFGKPDNYQFTSYQSVPAATSFSQPYQSVVTQPMGVAESAPVAEMSVSSLPEPEPISMSDAAPAVAAPVVAAKQAEPQQPDIEQDIQELASLPIDEPETIDVKQDVVAESAATREALEDKMTEIAPKASASSPTIAADTNSTFIWPVEGKVVSRFGPKSNGLINDGINIAATEGEPIWSAARGEVVYAGNELKGYGNMVIIRHDNGWMTAYAHASDTLVKKGDQVAQGDLLGYVGKTGSVTSPQLHFGIREGKKPVDPETLLPRRVASAR